MDIEEAKKLTNALNWSYFDMSEESSEEYIKAIETVLSELEKQDTEINKLKQENEQLKSELGYTIRLNYTGNHIPRID